MHVSVWRREGIQAVSTFSEMRSPSGLELCKQMSPCLESSMYHHIQGWSGLCMSVGVCLMWVVGTRFRSSCLQSSHYYQQNHLPSPLRFLPLGTFLSDALSPKWEGVGICILILILHTYLLGMISDSFSSFVLLLKIALCVEAFVSLCIYAPPVCLVS